MSQDARADLVRIADLRVPAVIGVHAWERATEQELTLAVDLAVAVDAAAASDDVADAVDYSAVAAAVSRVVQDGKFALIETAAERVADRVLRDFPVSRVRVEVAKPIAADGGAGSYTAIVVIERATAP
jgi:7,8-dihydroneopterin aldolase/epimerase/oxygenase